jgi:hypothetical protein
MTAAVSPPQPSRLYALERLAEMVDALFELVTRDAPKHEVVAQLQALGSRLEATIEVEHQLEERTPKRAPKAPPSPTELYARRVLRDAVARVEKGDVGVLILEARALTQLVRTGRLDGRLARVAIVDAATAAGIAADEIDRVLASAARST